MLFDLEDYINGGVIGPDAQCVDCGTWEDMQSTAKATRDAYFKSLNEWYNASVCCLAPDDPCRPAIVNMWERFQNFYQYYIDVWTRFWASLSCEGTFTDDICNEYKKAMIDLKCMVKQMMRLFDGDFTQTGSIPVITEKIGCTDMAAINYDSTATNLCEGCCQYTTVPTEGYTKSLYE